MEIMHRALVLREYGKVPSWEDYPKPIPKPGELLVKIQGCSVNPADREKINGLFLQVQLPAVLGREGAGRVVEANGSNMQGWLGKRISFAGSATWAQFAIAIPEKAFIIDQDIPLVSAASGIVNPLTAIAMTQIYNSFPNKKGLIHTAAASAVGRMLNKLCKTFKIPLLNIVRKKQHEVLLRSEGAEYVIVTEGDWVVQYQKAIEIHGFNILFDALGGGEITQKLIINLNKNSCVYLYGVLEGKPLTIESGLSLAKGITITGHSLYSWYVDVTKEKKNEIKGRHSELLRNELSSVSYKYVKFSEISEALELSVSKATLGKVTLIP